MESSNHIRSPIWEIIKSSAKPFVKGLVKGAAGTAIGGAMEVFKARYAEVSQENENIIHGRQTVSNDIIKPQQHEHSVETPISLVTNAPDVQINVASSIVDNMASRCISNTYKSPNTLNKIVSVLYS